MSLTFIYQSFTHVLTYETFCKEAMLQRVAWSETKEEFKLRCENAWSKLSSYCTNGVFEFDFIHRSFNELCKLDIVHAVDDIIEELCLTVEDRDYKCIPAYMLAPLSESEHCAFADCTTCDPARRNTLPGECKTAQCDHCGDLFQIEDMDTFDGICLPCSMKTLSTNEKRCYCGSELNLLPRKECEDCYYASQAGNR